MDFQQLVLLCTRRHLIQLMLVLYELLVPTNKRQVLPDENESSASTFFSNVAVVVVLFIIYRLHHQLWSDGGMQQV